MTRNVELFLEEFIIQISQPAVEPYFLICGSAETSPRTRYKQDAVEPPNLLNGLELC